MSDIFKAERQRLSQAENLVRLSGVGPATDMITVYSLEKGRQHDYCVYCALVPSRKIANSLRHSNWDLSLDSGLPGTAISAGRNGKPQVKYLRFGTPDAEPLIITREFYDIRPKYVELSEEFRHFHNLYHDSQLGHYYKIEDSGDEILVATIETNRVAVRLKELQQFLAIKEMHLILQFDYREFSSHDLETLKLVKGGQDYYEPSRCWALVYGGSLGLMDERKCFSRLHGKCIIRPVAKNESTFGGFCEQHPKEYVDFIIGVEDSGVEIRHTCDPGKLADYFGANPNAPHYLTPVHFRLEVLDKYYQKPGKYIVGDSLLRCGRLWSMDIDNHHDDRVCAWLGDLGQNLFYPEQFHWRSHNIPPSGKISDVFARRQLGAQWEDSSRLEDLFYERYCWVIEFSKKELGWPLLLPLEVGDAHWPRAIRVPSSNEQRDFDEVVLGLAKMLVDSLNEQRLGEMIPADCRGQSDRSIAKLDAVFAARGVQNYAAHIQFLRNLQELRSAGSAHRKGKKYMKIAADFGGEGATLQGRFCSILERAIEFLDFLREVVRSGKLLQEC